MTRRFACSVVLLLSCAASCTFAQEASQLSFCVVQNPVHGDKDPSGRNYAQNAGIDARELTIELTQRTRDGQPVTAVSLTRDAKSTNAAIERVGCSYVIDLERHVPAEESSFPDGLGPAYSMNDREMIKYTLRRHASRKKLLSAMVDPTTYRGRSEHPAFVPYPLIADAVLKKVLKNPGQKQQ